MGLLAQTAACNGAHRMDHRLARLLLVCHDAARAEQFAITQEFLAVMLGAQRPGVSLAAERLQRANAISYHRGLVKVLDRRRLETAACECYATVRNDFARIFA
jgi:CRP-like cAMP-binding protein